MMLRLAAANMALLVALQNHDTTVAGARAVLNARDYGAIPNDGKDDTLALRYGLGNCSATAELFIPPGQYTVSPLTMKQGGPLSEATVDILPVPSNCKVYGGGRTGPQATSIAMATTGGADGKGVNGVDGCWWRMFGWCGNSSKYLGTAASRRQPTSPSQTCICPARQTTRTTARLLASASMAGAHATPKPIESQQLQLNKV